MTKLAAFDLEIAKELPEYQCPKCKSEHIEIKDKMAMCLYCTEMNLAFHFRSDWKNHRPLGITCAAVYLSPQKQNGEYFEGHHQKVENGGKLRKSGAIGLVYSLLSMVDIGYQIVTWNGLSFDFDVLAEESGMHKECAELALNHVDLMFIVVTLRGHYLGLDKACKGAGVQGKLHEVKLNDGTILNDMSGGKAPALWKAGEYKAVLDYLADDVRSTLELAQWVEKNKKIRWISERGYEQVIKVPKLYTVRECLELNPKLPDWVTNPIDRKSMMEWIR